MELNKSCLLWTVVVFSQICCFQWCYIFQNKAVPFAVKRTMKNFPVEVHIRCIQVGCLYISLLWLSWIYNYMCKRCISPLKLWVWILLMARCTQYNKCHAADQWFSPGTKVSSTNKTDRHDITEIFFKVTLNIFKPNNQKCRPILPLAPVMISAYHH